MYAKNVATFLLYMVKEGKLQLNPQDDIIREHFADAGWRNCKRQRCANSLSCRRWLPNLKEEWMPADFISSLFVFILSAFLGFEVIKRVSPLLHTPLMSLTNALDAIVVVAAIIIAGRHETRACPPFSA